METSFFAQLSEEIMVFKESYGATMNPEELQKELKNIIEPILFSWIKENMPDITKDVLTEVVKENNKNKIEAMLAAWIQENMTNITKDILMEVVKKNKIDQKLVSGEVNESE
jgi:biotin-(acetyl-CoA carboxylase) ligase